MLGFTLACQDEFPGSRMCTSVEVMETTEVPVGLTGDAWVRPSFQPLAISSSSPQALDASGASTVAPNMMCRGWRSDDGSGLAVSASGGFSAPACAAEPGHAVACCAPVP